MQQLDATALQQLSLLAAPTLITNLPPSFDGIVHGSFFDDVNP